jgi:histidyl-tRNA synthetase
MGTQLIQPVKGTRDFYPEQMAFRNWLYGKIKEISERFGFQEYDGPEIEYLDLYAGKTSKEILSEQVFILKDRDGRELALRPELTPTFARMVAQTASTLPKPIRWFSFGRFWRYEQPQKGRGREAFQWEINILGPETPEADAEILAIAAEYFKALNLTSEEIVIRVSDREWLQNELLKLGLPQEQVLPLLRVMDRRDKLSPEDFQKALSEKGLTTVQIQGIEKILSENDYTKSPWLAKVFESLKLYNVLDYIKFDPSIIRGFDYYTRTVFEAWDKSGQLKRSIFGGGRFDNLTAQIGGERVPGIGMAPGDMPIQVVLEEYNKMPQLTPKAAKVLVTVFNPEFYQNSLEVSSRLRSNNIDTELWIDSDAKLEKQLKYTDQKKIPYAIIIGSNEIQENKVTLKNLTERTQETLTLEEVITKLS